MLTNTPAISLSPVALKRTPEIEKMIKLSEVEVAQTEWVNNAISSLARGRDHLIEYQSQIISDETWNLFLERTRNATETDVRKDWKTEDETWYSPRAKRIESDVQTLLWGEVTSDASILKLRIRRPFSCSQMLSIVDKVWAARGQSDIRYSTTALPKVSFAGFLKQWADKAALQLHTNTETITQRIYEGLRTHSPGNTKLKVFFAMLNNDCDEEFQFVQDHLVRAIRDNMRAIIETENPGSELQRENILEDRMKNLLYPSEWEETVRVLYSDKDVPLVLTACNKKIASYAPARKRIGPINVPNPAAKPGMIWYSDFVGVCLEFQFKSHVEYLRRFSQLFRSLDTNGSGILSDVQFHQLARTLSPNISDILINTYLDMVDPGHSKTITYSDATNCLHKEIDSWLSESPNVSSQKEMDRFVSCYRGRGWQKK
eukprot:TRINITY_DN8999_c0_g1_i1.p1 TRINITY_DN8999_c0_g1~~TRINITY_DN8999_c0_g1_i1.p1  ORF type:complete len:430 (+),score=57.74 TRINITY_DN8999_c0_g1_i1:546-1835(+)